MGTIYPFETLGKRLSSAAVSYPEERNPQVQWRQDINTFAPKCLRMHDRAALRNANRSISKAFITVIQDTLLAPDFVRKNSFYNYNTIFRNSTLLPSSGSKYLVVLVEWAAFRRCVFLNVINHHQDATHMNQLSKSHQIFFVDLKYLVLWKNFAAC
jgi:hypothetical protein